MVDFIPARDTDALAWMLNFSTKITANPATYQVAVADAVAIANAVDAFDAALTIVQDPAQNTEVTIAAKDDARTSADQICRQFAALIKPNMGISDPDKISIGVPPPNNDRNPIDVPDTSPILSVIAATPGAHTVRYSDSFTPDSPAKPFGAANMQVFVAIDVAAVSDPAQAEFYGAFTRNPLVIAFSAPDNGKQATYFARWASVKGDVGPWSSPVSLAIAA